MRALFALSDIGHSRRSDCIRQAWLGDWSPVALTRGTEAMYQTNRQSVSANVQCRLVLPRAEGPEPTDIDDEEVPPLLGSELCIGLVGDRVPEAGSLSPEVAVVVSLFRQFTGPGTRGSLG